MKKVKIINYPSTLEAAHALIDVLVDELNDYKEFVLADADDCCVPYQMIKGSDTAIQPPPAGINGECSNNIVGGVRFENATPFGVSRGHGKILHTPEPHSDAARGVFMEQNAPQTTVYDPCAGF